MRSVVLTLVGLSFLLVSSGMNVNAEEPQARATDPSSDVYSIARETDGVLVRSPDGKPVFRYMTRKPEGTKLTANSACCLHPVYTPAGVPVTAFAPSDHLHHRGVFLAWYAMRGAKDADFWGWGQFAPTKDRVIVNRGVQAVKLAKDRAEIRIDNEWLAEGQVMVREELVAATHQSGDVYVIDLAYRLIPTADLKLDRSAFAGFCFRGRNDGSASYSDPDGSVTLPDPHHLKPETDWPPKDWYDYTIALKEDKTVGLTVIDHPKNGTTGWHNNRLVWMVNPCNTAAGEVRLEKGKPLVLQFRLVAHDGPAPRELLQKLAAEWRAR